MQFSVVVTSQDKHPAHTEPLYAAQLMHIQLVSSVAVCHTVFAGMQKDSTLSKLAAMEGAVPKQLQPTFKKVMQRLQKVPAS